MITWSYLAGFLDGDGWITSSQNKNAKTRRFAVGYTQKYTQEIYMREIYKFLLDNEISSSWIYRISKTKRAPKPTKMINITIRDQESIVRILSEITPFLLIKKGKAIDCLSDIRNRWEKIGRGKQRFESAKSRDWTKEEIDIMVSLKASGFNNPAIAIKLERTTHSVSQKYAKYVKAMSPLPC